jgi:hypothetical protein
VFVGAIIAAALTGGDSEMSAPKMPAFGSFEFDQSAAWLDKGLKDPNLSPLEKLNRLEEMASYFAPAVEQLKREASEGGPSIHEVATV